MPAHSDRRNRKSLLRDLFVELSPERQAVELEVLEEIHRLAKKSAVEAKTPPPADECPNCANPPHEGPCRRKVEAPGAAQRESLEE